RSHRGDGDGVPVTRRRDRWRICAGMALCLVGSSVSSLAAAQTQAQAEAVPWSLHLSAGVGAGTRDFDLPQDGVIDQTRSGAFPAAELEFELDHLVSDRVMLGLLIRYQSSIGLRLVEHLTDGSEHARDTRSHRLELALAPTFRFDAN